MKKNGFKYLFTKLLGLACLVYMMGCSDNEEKQRYTIVATTGMIGDAIKNIVQDTANVVTIMGPGVDPHLYKATQGDLIKLNTANIIFYNGLHLEGKIADIFSKLKQVKPVYAVSETLDEARFLVDPNFPTGKDPHIWFDVCLWRDAVAYISQVLQKEDSSHAKFYAKNTAKYLQQLDTLHVTVARTIQKIPKTQRVLITAHDAFSYFGRAYDIQVKGLQGISTLSEFGLKDIIELVQLIIKNKVKAIFLETSTPDKPIQAVMEGCKNQGYEVKIGAALYSDAMGEVGTIENTYIGMIKKNVANILAALQ